MTPPLSHNPQSANRLPPRRTGAQHPHNKQCELASAVIPQASQPDNPPATIARLENRQCVDQRHPAIVLIAAHAGLFSRQGSVNPTWRYRNGVKLGPYYRLNYRQDGRQRAVYLGREGPLVQRIRQMLSTLQKPLRQNRLYDRLEHEARSALRANNRRLTELLRPLGLRLKGFEVRGWRTSLLRARLPRCTVPSLTRQKIRSAKSTQQNTNPLSLAKTVHATSCQQTSRTCASCPLRNACPYHGFRPATPTQKNNTTQGRCMLPVALNWPRLPDCS
jgi:hypothetical protein